MLREIERVWRQNRIELSEKRNEKVKKEHSSIAASRLIFYQGFVN